MIILLLLLPVQPGDGAPPPRSALPKGRAGSSGAPPPISPPPHLSVTRAAKKDPLASLPGAPPPPSDQISL